MWPQFIFLFSNHSLEEERVLVREMDRNGDEEGMSEKDTSIL